MLLNQSITFEKDRSCYFCHSRDLTKKNLFLLLLLRRGTELFHLFFASSIEVACHVTQVPTHKENMIQSRKIGRGGEGQSWTIEGSIDPDNFMNAQPII